MHFQNRNLFLVGTRLRLVLLAVTIFVLHAKLASAIDTDTSTRTIIAAAAAAQEAIYTENEIRAIEKLRKSLKSSSTGTTVLPHDYMNRDEYLISWLRARDLNVERAKEMLMQNIKWRTEEKIDQLSSEPFPQFEKHLIYDVQSSTDKEGRPVLLLPAAKWNIRKIVLAGQLPQLLRYMTKILLEIPAQAGRKAGQLNGSNSTQYYVFPDLAGFNLRQHACIQCLQIFLYYVQTYENYYPQGAKEHIFINTPQIFDTIVTLTRSIWSSHLVDHIIFLGFEKKEWAPVLEKYFDLDRLPAQFGGTNPKKI